MAYSSKDMAREAGMTTEGLRFYEKSGIIKVKKNAKNGYRVYEVMQVPFLRMAKILNTYGIPLHDIRRFFHKGDEALGGLLATMEQKQEDLRLELWRKGRILERLEYQSDLIRRAVETYAREQGDARAHFFLLPMGPEAGLGARNHWHLWRRQRPPPSGDREERCG